MTESEIQLETLALSIGRARRGNGYPVEAAPAPADLPAMGGEARHRECLVSMLASGSKGNATFIRCGRTKILVDAGISCRRIEQGLKRYSCSLSDLDAIFITHEHADHVNGLATILKKADAVLTVDTAEELDKALYMLSSDHELRNKLGRRAHEAITAHSGATEKNIEQLEKLF